MFKNKWPHKNSINGNKVMYGVSNFHLIWSDAMILYAHRRWLNEKLVNNVPRMRQHQQIACTIDKKKQTSQVYDSTREGRDRMYERGRRNCETLHWNKASQWKMKQKKMVRNELNIYFYVNFTVFHLHKINEYKWNEMMWIQINKMPKEKQQMQKMSNSSYKWIKEG